MEALKYLKKKHKDVITLKRLKHKVSSFMEQFGGNSQHDAQEFLTYLVSVIHDELRTSPAKKVELLLPLGIR